MSIIEE